MTTAAWDWVDLIDQNVDDEFTVLPEIMRTKPDQYGICKEISFRFDEEDNSKIIRSEKKIQVMKKHQKISRAAIKRKANFVKFGKCKSIPRGVIERGVATVHRDDFPFLFEGDIAGKRTKVASKPIVKVDNNARKMPVMLELKDDSAPTTTKPKAWAIDRNSKYLSPDETYEIRISNLPIIELPAEETDGLTLQDIEQKEKNVTSSNVRRLINDFYQNILGAKPESRYRVYCFKTRRTQDMNAIVEFKSIKYRELAIKHLHGHQYGYNILTVEKSKPRRPRY